MKKQKLFLNVISTVITITFLWNQCVRANGLSTNTLANQSDVRVVVPVALPAMDALGTVRRLMEDGILTMEDLVRANSVRRGILPDGKGCLISEDTAGERAYYVFYERQRFYHRVTTSIDVEDKLGILLLSLGIPIISEPIPAEVDGQTLFERQIAITERQERYIESLLGIVYPEGIDLASVPTTASQAHAVVYEARTVQPQEPENITGALGEYLKELVIFATGKRVMRQAAITRHNRGLSVIIFALLAPLAIAACMHVTTPDKTRSPADLIAAFQRGDVSVNSLSDLLKRADISGDVRITVIKKLGEQGDLPEVPSLIKQLEHRDYLVRKEAATGLGKILDRNSEAARIYRAKFGPRYREVLKAYSLIDYIYEEDIGGADYTYIQAWKPLVELGDPAHPALSAALNDYGRYFRGCAAATLLRIGDENPELEAHVAIGKEDWEKVLQLGYAAVSPLVANLSDSSILEILPGFVDGEGAESLIGDLSNGHEYHVKNTIRILEILGYRFSQQKPEGVPEPVKVTVYKFRLMPVGTPVTYKIIKEEERVMYMWKPALGKRPMKRDERREQDARDLLDFVREEPEGVGKPEIFGLRIILNDPNMELQLRYEAADALFNLGHYRALYDAMRNSRDNGFRAYVAVRLLDVENGKKELYIVLFRKWLPYELNIKLSELKKYLDAYLYVGVESWDTVRQSGDKAIPALLDGLRDNNPHIRGMCAYSLLKIVNDNPDGLGDVMDSEVGIGYVKILEAYEMVWRGQWDEVEKLGGAAVPALEAAVNLNGDIRAAEVLARLGDERASDFLNGQLVPLEEKLRTKEGVEDAKRKLKELGYVLAKTREGLIDPELVAVWDEEKGRVIPMWLGRPAEADTPPQGSVVPIVPLTINTKSERGSIYPSVAIIFVILAGIIIFMVASVYNHGVLFAPDVLFSDWIMPLRFIFASLILGGILTYIAYMLNFAAHWYLRRLGKGSDDRRRRTTEQLARMTGKHEWVVPKLIRLLKEGNAEQSREAARTLGESGDEIAIEELGEILNDPSRYSPEDADAYIVVAEALAKKNIGKTYNIWIGILRNTEKDPSIRIKAAEVLGEREGELGELANSEIDQILFIWLEYELNDDLRAKAAELLARRGTEPAVDELIRKLRRHPIDPAVLRGILALERIRVEGLITALTDIMKDESVDQETRRAVAKKLLEEGVEEAELYREGRLVFEIKRESQYTREIREDEEEKIVMKLGLNHEGRLGEEKEVGDVKRLAEEIVGVDQTEVIVEVKKRLQAELSELEREEGTGIFGAVKEIWLVDNLGGLESVVRDEKGAVAVLQDGIVLIDIDAFDHKMVLRDVIKHELWESILELVETNAGVREVTAIYQNLKDFTELPEREQRNLIDYLCDSDELLNSMEYGLLLDYIVNNKVTGDDLIAMALGYVLKTERYSHLRESLEGIVDEDIKGAVERLDLAQGIYDELIQATREKQVVETVKDAERKSRAVMKAKMVISRLPVIETDFVQGLLDSGKFIRLDMDELIKPGNEYIMQWLEKLLRDRAEKSPFILFSRSGDTTVGDLLKDYEGLSADKFQTDNDVGQETPRENIGTLYDLAGEQPSAEERERGLSIPHMYSATGIYLAAQVVMANGNISTISDPLVKSTLEAFYEAIFGDEFSEEEQWWRDLFDGKKWPPLQRVTVILDDLRKAIVHLEKAA